MMKKVFLFLFVGVGLGLNVSPAFAKACEVSSKHAPIPKSIHNEPRYDEVRVKLIDAGWQPVQSVHHTEVDNQSGNFEVFWNRGYTEVESCAGTGLAPCSFNFRDIYGNTLSVFTVGEEDSSPDAEYGAVVTEVALECRDK